MLDEYSVTDKKVHLERTRAGSEDNSPLESGDLNTEGTPDINKFKSIESIACYLQGQYGFKEFKEIYNKVASINEKCRGKVLLDKYIDELKDYLTTVQIEKHLVLFLALCHIKG